MRSAFEAGGTEKEADPACAPNCCSQPTPFSPLPILSLCQVASWPNGDAQMLHKLHGWPASLTISSGLMDL
ncbi:hypothetical protein EYF80_008289 [Liparis tanakae]|uniref:Uncharacterized protein n=1 Tax=Liparis tanakae TaxID=230148 RepID=A0A4Z2IUU8_9TELE|nr:hypothetical protein EYF80_008289 [Liparis tanakae]